MFHNIFTGCTITVNLWIQTKVRGSFRIGAPDKLSLKLLHFKFIAVHITGREIHIVFHFELTLDFRFYI